MDKMKILVIGSGGREHAIVVALAKSSVVEQIYITPGNGGTTSIDKVSPLNLPFKGSDFSALTAFALENGIGLVVPGPEQPLVDGIATAFQKIGIPVFGPSAKAAQLEGSKAYSKEFMKRHHIPTADFATFTSTEYDKAVSYLKSHYKGGDVVIKASGLAAGKGVILPETIQEGIEALSSILVSKTFGEEAGSEVVIEERLEGEEVSVLAFSDGYTVIPMPAAQDHKRVWDGDKGPNTGGMGAYAPAPIYTPTIAERIMRTVLKPTIDGMRKQGTPFIGVLYAGLMLTPSGPKVLEYNCRFGDPETQVVLPLFDTESSDLAKVMYACATGCLDSVPVVFKPGFAATVVAASGGYPGSYEKNKPITLPSTLPSNVTIYHAGTKVEQGKLLTSGGRVLAVTALGDQLENALEMARDVAAQVSFDGVHYRKDIGHRAIRLLAEQQSKQAGATYEAAGVSIDSGNLLVEKIKASVKATSRSGTDAEIGGFGGMFDLKAAGYYDPILVSGTDGVGTKLKIAQAIQKHDTIGIDLVAMSVNDVVVQGAEPLFFLDYYGCSHLEVDVAQHVVEGIAKGCLESGCALIGGETAEMPGLYEPGDYDLAGFVVGAVDRDKVLPRMNEIVPGDVILGLPSSGVHSNGFSLVRHVVKTAGLDYHSPVPFETTSPNMSLGEALLTPTRLYVKPLLPLIRQGLIKAMAHITGGGFIDNIPRALPKDMGCVIQAGSWPLLPVFQWLKKVGRIDDLEMARTFNCGIGMVIITDAKSAKSIQESLKEAGEPVYEIGMVVHRGANLGLPVKMKGMESAWN